MYQSFSTFSQIITFQLKILKKSTVQNGIYCVIIQKAYTRYCVLEEKEK